MIVYSIYGGKVYNFHYITKTNYSPYSKTGSVGGNTNTVMYTLKCGAKVYVSYQTIIGVEYMGTLYTIRIKYSVSTSKHQSYLPWELDTVIYEDERKWDEFVQYMEKVQFSVIDVVNDELNLRRVL